MSVCESERSSQPVEHVCFSLSGVCDVSVWFI